MVKLIINLLRSQDYKLKSNPISKEYISISDSTSF